MKNGNKKRESSNVFKGSRAILDFLNPDNNLPTPLVELPGRLNPFAKNKVRIFAKLMYLLPLLNLKSLTALNMLFEAKKAGELKGVDTIVEHSSGNTAFSLAAIAPLFGINNVKAIVPKDIAPGKLELLRLFGAELVFNEELPGKPSGIEKARRMGKKKNHFNPAQYENKANGSAHEKWTTHQIWNQLGSDLTIFCAALGTSGTVVGASNYFRKKSKNIAIVGTLCAPKHAVPGVRNEKRLKEIKLDWNKAIDYKIEAETRESFKNSLELCRAGIMAGPSSGLALAGLLKFLKNNSADFDKFRNSKGEVVATFICADTPLPYLDKYSTHLDPGDF